MGTEEADDAGEHYDVIVAGAGPAGAQAARDLGRRGRSVLVLETEAEDEFPRQSNKSTGGTFPQMLAAFGIPDEVVMHFTDDVVLESPTDYYVQHTPGAVLDFPAFKRFLVADGREAGAEYRFDARVNAPIMIDGEIAGVQYSGDQEVYADIVIDATGPGATLASKLGVSELDRRNQAVAVEHEMSGVDLDHENYADLTDAMMLRLDHDIAPGGYSWIFHTGEDTAKVGLTYLQNEAHARRAQEGMTMDGYLERWLESDPRFADAERIAGRQHRGSAHYQMPGRMSTDNFMAIGDTVPTIDPVWGEGIDVGMKSGRAAAIIADRCFIDSHRNTDATEMARYDELWHREVAPNMRKRLLLGQLLYRAPNERYDRFMRDLRAIDGESLQGANAGRIVDLLKLLHLTDAPLLVQLGRDWWREDL